MSRGANFLNFPGIFEVILSFDFLKNWKTAQMIEKICLWMTSCEFNLNKKDGLSSVKASIQLFNIGYQYFQDQNYDSALLFFQKAQNRFSEYPDAYYYQGLVYLQRGEEFLARYQFKQTLQLNRDYLPAQIRLVELTNNKTDAETILQDIEIMLNASEYKTQPPFSQSTFWYLNYLKARMLFITGDYSNCLASLDTESKRLNPTSPEIYLLEGLLNTKRDRESDASKNFDEAMKRALDNFYDYRELARRIQDKTAGRF